MDVTPDDVATLALGDPPMTVPDPPPPIVDPRKRCIATDHTGTLVCGRLTGFEDGGPPGPDADLCDRHRAVMSNSRLGAFPTLKKGVPVYLCACCEKTEEADPMGGPPAEWLTLKKLGETRAVGTYCSWDCTAKANTPKGGK